MQAETAKPIPFCLDWRPALLGAAGLALYFAAPVHRLDLAAFGLLAAVAAAVWQVEAGLFLVGLALPTFFFDRQLVGPVSVTPPGLALLLAWLGVLIQAARQRWRNGAQRDETAVLAWPATRYAAPMALLLAAALLSLLVSQYLLESVRELRALILEPALFFWLLVVTRRTGAPRAALLGFLMAAVLVALAAIGQVASGVGGTQAEGVRRAQAWYPSPNHLGLMLGRAFPFYAAFWLQVGAPSAWRRLRWLAALGAAVLALGILLTFSLGAWLGTAAALVVLLFALDRRHLALWLAGIGAVVFLAISGLAVVGRLPERLDPFRQTSGFRLDLWRSTLRMLRDHPVLGVGMDNFVYLYQQIYLLEGAAAEPNLSHPHNWLLQFWVELGLPGLIAFLWLLWRFGRAARQALSSLLGTRRWLVAGALGAMADMLVHGFIDNSYFLVDLAFVFWLLLALVEQAVEVWNVGAARPAAPVRVVGANGRPRQRVRVSPRASG